jgi:hypothetical protein
VKLVAVDREFTIMRRVGAIGPKSNMHQMFKRGN